MPGKIFQKVLHRKGSEARLVAAAELKGVISSEIPAAFPELWIIRSGVYLLEALAAQSLNAEVDG